MLEDIVIIGNGPGAYVAGIYAATANTNPLIIIDPSSSISEFKNVNKIAGLVECTNNDQYLVLLKEQAQRFNVRFTNQAIREIYFGKNIKIVTDNEEISTKACIIDDLCIARRILHSDLLNESNVFCEDKSTITPIPGLFVCGSAREVMKEAILFSASGCMAALDAKEHIENYIE
ncbi:hypothetical protein COBT_001338 [Conglomerata obtusa]